MPFNCREFTLEYLKRLSFRTASTALTSLGEVPRPLNRRIGGASFDAGGAQAVRANEAMHEIRWKLRFFTRCEQRLTQPTERMSHGEERVNGGGLQDDMTAPSMSCGPNLYNDAGGT